MLTSTKGTHPPTVVAFYSYPDGNGRSCMVANTALIMASQGYRVLVMDLDLASPSQYRYLSAFLPETPGGPSPIRLTCQFNDQRGSVDFLGPTTDVVRDPEGFTVRRADMTQQGYDYVLVDTPAAPAATVVAKDLADILVVGYSLNKQAMDKAAQHARAVQGSDHGRAIRVFPVPMRVDQKASGVTTRMRAEGRRQFAWLLADMEEDKRRQYWNNIEIPYEADYAVEESLPFLDDSSDERDRLVEAYLHVAALVTVDGRPVRQGAVTDQTRARYRASQVAAAGGNAPIAVLHVGADRYWAEWLVTELQRMGLSAARQRIDQIDPANGWENDSLMLVVSEAFLAFPGLDHYLAIVASDAAIGGQAPLAVSIDHSRLPSVQLSTIGYLELGGTSARNAQRDLADYYEVSPSSGAPASSHPAYYPGRTPPRWNLPSRASAFHGRDDALDLIRDYLTSAGGKHPFMLAGPAGIGKSQLALEYAYRFAACYDLIYLIRADGVQTIQAGLAALADRIQSAREGDAPMAALHKLQSDAAEPANWLLIYDGVETPGELDGLLPEPDHGHVLLTSRAQSAGPWAHLTVKPLDPVDSDGMLMELVPGIVPSEARTLAAELHEIPLALNLAASWIGVVVQRLLDAGVSPATVTSNVIQEFRDQLTVSVGEHARAYQEHRTSPLEITVALLIDLLTADERGAAAILLLETCAFLAPIGISQRLLRSPEMLRQLGEADAEIGDPVVLHNVLRVLVTYGLSLLTETVQAPLQIHPLVLDVLRDQLSQEQRVQRSAAVAQMLAASAPLDIDDDVISHAEIYIELQQHLEPSGAWHETDFAVRRWLVNQIRFLWQTETVSAWTTAAELGERLSSYWSATLPDKEDDTLLLRMQTQLANVYRSRCDFDRAREMDLGVLSRQRRVLGLRHLRTLMTARGYAADLRLVGDFEGALLEDQSTAQAFSQTLGDDHLMTIVASSNLALSELMSGEPEQALERQKLDLTRCQRIIAERPTQVAWILFHIGTLLRELGYYAESRDRLQEAKTEFDDLVANGVLAPTVWVVLRTAAGLAITQRRLGGSRLAATDAALSECRRTYGDLYPDVLAMSLSRAGDLHAAKRQNEAVDQAQSALEGYETVFSPDHPFTSLCQVDLSIYALAAGSKNIADEMSRRGWSALDRAFGPRHLWSLAATVARANVCAATGRLHEARELETQALAEYRRRLGPYHPFTRILGINAADTRLLLNESEDITPREAGANRRRSIELDVPPY